LELPSRSLTETHKGAEFKVENIQTRCINFKWAQVWSTFHQSRRTDVEIGFIPHLWALAASYLDSAFLGFLNWVCSAHPKYSRVRGFQAIGADNPRISTSYENHPSELWEDEVSKVLMLIFESREHKQING
jgi:hypothetical protein